MKLSAMLLGAFALAFTTGNAPAQVRDDHRQQRSRWQGTITDPPLTISSPLSPVPASPGGARRLILPLPTQDIPPAARLPMAHGGGQITLLAPWRKGWLIGTNGGEWGGTLYTFESGRLNRLANGPVIGGFTWRGSLYVLSGLNHLMTNSGELWKVDLGGSPSVRRTALPAEPTDVVVLEDGRLIVRSDGGDVVLKADGTISPTGPR